MSNSWDNLRKKFATDELQPLKRIIVSNSSDGTQVSRVPNNEEIMNKINEIIRYLKNVN